MSQRTNVYDESEDFSNVQSEEVSRDIDLNEAFIMDESSSSVSEDLASDVIEPTELGIQADVEGNELKDICSETNILETSSSSDDINPISGTSDPDDSLTFHHIPPSTSQLPRMRIFKAMSYIEPATSGSSIDKEIKCSRSGTQL